METNFLRTSIMVAVSIITFISCKKDNRPGDPQLPPPSPVKTAKGNPLGNAVTKTIGAAGGSLTSSDGKISISVPAGTVATNTLFSIQPISNTLPGKEDRPAYRLLPEGTAFAKNISIVYRYDSTDIRGSSEDLLTASYQTADGNWKMVSSSLNKTAHTLTLSTNHFSDWTVFSLIELKPLKPAVGLHDTVAFSIQGFGTVHDEISYLGPDSDYSGSISWIGNWKVIAGNGTLAASKDDKLMATYKPPSPLVNGTKAIVEVEIKGVIVISDSTFPGGKRSFGQMILRGEVLQVNDVFMMGSFNGQDVMCTDAEAFLTGDQLTINATMTTDSSSVNYSITVSGADRPSLYPCGDITKPDAGEVRAIGNTGGQPVAYSTNYIKCGPPAQMAYSPGAIHVQTLGAVGTYITGSFDGPLYKLADVCSPSSRTLAVSFRAKRVL